MIFRCMLRRTVAAPVSPAFHADWDVTADALRRLLDDQRIADAASASASITWNAGQTALAYQFVGRPLRGGIRLNGAALWGVSRFIEDNADNNAIVICGLRVVDLSGTIERGELLAVGDHGSGTEIAAGSTPSRLFGNGDVVADYTTIEGDRLVLEVGFTDNAGTTPQAQMNHGASVANLVDDYVTTEGSTSGFNSWIELLGSTDPIVMLTSTPGEIRPYTVGPYTVGA